LRKSNNGCSFGRHGVLKRDRIALLKSYRQALEQKCGFPEVFCDDSDYYHHHYYYLMCRKRIPRTSRSHREGSISSQIPMICHPLVNCFSFLSVFDFCIVPKLSYTEFISPFSISV